MLFSRRFGWYAHWERKKSAHSKQPDKCSIYVSISQSMILRETCAIMPNSVMIVGLDFFDIFHQFWLFISFYFISISYNTLASVFQLFYLQQLSLLSLRINLILIKKEENTQIQKSLFDSHFNRSYQQTHTHTHSVQLISMFIHFSAYFMCFWNIHFEIFKINLLHSVLASNLAKLVATVGATHTSWKCMNLLSCDHKISSSRWR